MLRGVFASATSAPGKRPSKLAAAIKRKLKKQLDPVVLRVVDNSAKYGAAAETYYKVRVVSQVFEGKPIMQRHRLVYGILDDELSAGVKRVAVEARSPSEELKAPADEEAQAADEA
eukprot:jgi/Tetstr1/462346/TSEL_007352.t1